MITKGKKIQNEAEMVSKSELRLGDISVKEAKTSIGTIKDLEEMADVNRGNRPLSPHIMIYRPQLTSISSILVRITGIGLLAFTALIVWWLIAAATSEAAFGFIDGLLRSFVGDILLLLATWGAFYHMLGRLRHVIWDFGYGLKIEKSEMMAKGMFVLATVMTLFVMIIT